MALVWSKLQSPSLHGPCKEPCLGSVFTWSYYSVILQQIFEGILFRKVSPLKYISFRPHKTWLSLGQDCGPWSNR